MFIIILAVTIYFTSKKHLLDTFPNEEVSAFRNKAVNMFQNEGYKVREKGEKVIIEKGSLTSAGLYFKQNGLQVDVYRFSTATALAWILIAFGIVLMGIVTLIIAVISESNSVNFAEDTLRPLLKGHGDSNRRCPNCGRIIPFDSIICPYCGKKF